MEAVAITAIATVISLVVLAFIATRPRRHKCTAREMVACHLNAGLGILDTSAEGGVETAMVDGVPIVVLLELLVAAPSVLAITAACFQDRISKQGWYKCVRGVNV